jgi:hypothetical protein
MRNRRHQPPSRASRGRRLVVVDIENVAGGAVLYAEQAAWARLAIEKAIPFDGDEQIVVGTSHVGVLASGVGWPGPRIVARSGVDGADLALLEVLTTERVEERFESVVLVSGDGIFTAAVAALEAQGLDVTVVAHVDGCATRLRLAASRTVFLEDAAAGSGSNSCVASRTSPREADPKPVADVAPAGR